VASTADDSPELAGGRTVKSRRRFITDFVIALMPLGATASAQEYKAQHAQTRHRVGWLSLGSETASISMQKVLREALRNLGWTGNKEIVFESVFAEGRAERLPSLVAELLSRQVQLIVASGTTAIQAAKEATRTIPIVMLGGGDPVGTGLVQSIARPGGNVTGVSLLGEELSAKTLDLMKQMLPRLGALVLIRAAANPANQFFLNHFDAAGRKLGIRVIPLDIRTPDDFTEVFARLTADAGFILLDPMFSPHRARIAQFAIERRLPLVSADRSFAEAGLLFSHGFQYDEVVRAAAPFIDKILRGAKPGELPIEQPNKLDLAINLKTARALGLTIPPSLLARADQVIE
jgi:putative tryptophan/tyrosine transport system substrate-binding protein